MKKRKKVGLFIFFSMLIISCLIISLIKICSKAAQKPEPQWLIKKEALAKQHEQSVKTLKERTEQEKKNSTIIATPNLSTPTSIFIVNVGEFNNGDQLPLSSEDASEFIFSSTASTSFVELFGGSCKDNKSKGVIFEFKVDSVTMQDSRNLIYIRDVGTIKFSKVNNNIVYFTTSNGNTGEINVITDKYTLK